MRRKILLLIFSVISVVSVVQYPCHRIDEKAQHDPKHAREKTLSPSVPLAIFASWREETTQVTRHAQRPRLEQKSHATRSGRMSGPMPTTRDTDFCGIIRPLPLNRTPIS